jgi:hypothetical protein
MSNVIWIKEWLHRQSMRRLKAYIHRNGGQCWYPIRQKENGNWELEPVYGVPEPVCVLRPKPSEPSE